MSASDDDFDLDPAALQRVGRAEGEALSAPNVASGTSAGMGARLRGELSEDGVFTGPLIPRGGAFEGQVAIVGPTRIEGSVRGSIRGRGDLHVGPGARIEGRIECDALASQGEIVGPVRARTRAHFGAGARLDGDLEVPIMVFEDDAIWNGRATIPGHHRLDRGPDSGADDEPAQSD